MHCIAIDDEPMALTIIQNYCQRMGDIQLETFTNPIEGLQHIEQERPDIAFLDIEMNGLTGMDIARRVKPPTCVIFTTAYANYAVDSYEVDAVDFLHKPFFYARFVKAVDRARDRIRLNAAATMAQRPERMITLKVEYKNVNVPVDAIVYVEAMDNYVKLHLADRSTLLSQVSMKHMEELLPQGEFIRVHRSFIVARNKIVSSTRQSVTLRGAQRAIPVGRGYAQNMKS